MKNKALIIFFLMIFLYSPVFALTTNRACTSIVDYQWDQSGCCYKCCTCIDGIGGDIIFTDVDDEKYSFHLQNMPADTGTISNVRVYANLRKASGSVSYKFFVKVGSTYYYSSNVNVWHGAWEYEYKDWATNPATDQAWTISNVNNLVAGIINQNSGQIQVNHIYVQVTYIAVTTTTTTTTYIDNHYNHSSMLIQLLGSMCG